jgi:hypothetical protein
MRGVWRELHRHPTRLSSKASPKAQDAALIEVFDTALACMQEDNTTVTRKQARQGRDWLLDVAVQLEFEVMPSSPWADRLTAAASICQDYAKERYAADIATATVRQRDGQARWIAMTISNVFQRRYGKSMYTQTARITSVILGREILVNTVAKWCKAHPVNKKPKIGRKLQPSNPPRSVNKRPKIVR